MKRNPPKAVEASCEGTMRCKNLTGSFIAAVFRLVKAWGSGRGVEEHKPSYHRSSRTYSTRTFYQKKAGVAQGLMSIKRAQWNLIKDYAIDHAMIPIT